MVSGELGSLYAVSSNSSATLPVQSLGIFTTVGLQSSQRLGQTGIESMETRIPSNAHRYLFSLQHPLHIQIVMLRRPRHATPLVHQMNAIKPGHIRSKVGNAAATRSAQSAKVQQQHRHMKRHHGTYPVIKLIHMSASIPCLYLGSTLVLRKIGFFSIDTAKPARQQPATMMSHRQFQIQ